MVPNHGKDARRSPVQVRGRGGLEPTIIVCNPRILRHIQPAGNVQVKKMWDCNKQIYALYVYMGQGVAEHPRPSFNLASVPCMRHGYLGVRPTSPTGDGHQNRSGRHRRGVKGGKRSSLAGEKSWEAISKARLLRCYFIYYSVVYSRPTLCRTI